jgi:hypothetical protein
MMIQLRHEGEGWIMDIAASASRWSRYLSATGTVLVLLSTSVPASAQDPLVLGQIYDDDGTFVGTMTSHDQESGRGQVFREIDGDVVELIVNNRFQRVEPLGTLVWFSGAGCTGQAYAEAAEPGMSALAGVLAGGGLPNVFYFAPAGTVAIAAAAAASSASFNGACGGPAPLPAAFFPVSPSPDPLVFTPPFGAQPSPGFNTISAVPGLERWGLVGLGLALALAALGVLRRLV